MDTFDAIMMGEMNRGSEQKVFDWDQAAQIIKERSATEASAGLEEDWGWTAGVIYQNGNPVMDSYTYLASTWATPVLEITVTDGIETIPCFKMKSEVPGWDSKTKWPDSSLEILNE